MSEYVEKGRRMATARIDDTVAKRKILKGKAAPVLCTECGQWHWRPDHLTVCVGCDLARATGRRL